MKKVASALGLLISLLLLFSGVICQNEEDADEVTVEAVTDDVPYESPTPSDSARVYFSDHFDNEQRFEQKWVRSQAKKEGIDEDIAKYDGTWAIETPNRDGLRGDLGLVLKTQAKHAAISAPLIKPFVFDTKPLIVQYEVTLQDGQQCGGAYLKLLSKGTNDLKSFHDKTPYTIMFGPDKCGNDYKLHFIFNHRNPLNGSLEEKHCKKSEQRLEDLINDKFPHLYTLILNPDNSFEIHIDNKLVNSGGLLTDFTPEVNPPAEIDDPKDTKPTDWDEREKIPDPEAVKPEDWDDDAPAQIVDETAVMPDGWLSSEPAHIADPSAKKPEDWDSEMDGEWEPPLVDNPACAGAVGCGPWEPPLINNPAFKGKWRAPLVDNPNYKGKWLPRKIPNPDYFEDKTPFKMTTISAVGFELWSMSKDILFDNIIITEELSVAQKWAQDTFEKKRQKIAKDSGTLWGKILKLTNYKPGIWGIYFVYCSIPVVIYAGYLIYCVWEESVIDKIAEVTAQYPFLWVLYIIIFGIPVVSILYFCFKPADKPKEKMEQKKAAETKKTDEVVEDDKDTVESESQETKDSGEEEEEEDNEEADEEEEVEHSAKENSAPPPETTRKRKVRKE